MATVSSITNCFLFPLSLSTTDDAGVVWFSYKEECDALIKLKLSIELLHLSPVMALNSSNPPSFSTDDDLLLLFLFHYPPCF